MGNTSKRKPPRAPGAAPRPPTPPPRFAIVRGEYKGAVAKIDIYNLDHVVHVVSHVYGEERAIELWTLGPDPIVLTGKAAADMLAHFILCGIDVEGAPEALASSRGEMYAPYIEPPPAELPDPDETGRDACSGCAFENNETCAGWIPGGLDDACGAFEAAAADAGKRFDEHGGGCACLTPPPPPPARAIGEIRIGFVGKPEKIPANAAKHWESTRASCAFGANCKRFPACGDCSLYALDRLCESANQREYLDESDGDGERRAVHVEHVEQVSGETAAHLLERVERCGVFVGLKARGVVPGDQWCGVGHEMTDPACALCPYLRIYAPAL